MSIISSDSQLTPHRYGLAFFCVFGAFFALDQWTKYLVYSHLKVGQSVELPVRIFQWTYVRNFGSAFGMMEDAFLVFVTAALLTIGLIYWQFPYICKVLGMWGCVTSATIVAGAMGNLFDRLRLGYVVDMIDFRWWPVFNVADIGITVGLTLLVVLLFWLDREESHSVPPAQDK